MEKEINKTGITYANGKKLMPTTMQALKERMKADLEKENIKNLLIVVEQDKK